MNFFSVVLTEVHRRNYSFIFMSYRTEYIENYRDDENKLRLFFNSRLRSPSDELRGSGISVSKNHK